MSGSRTAPKRAVPAREPSPVEPFALAQALYARRRWSDAERLCRAILQHQSNHPGALTLLGIMLAQTRRSAEAAELLGRAVRRLPNDPAAHINHGNVLRDLGRTQDALARYERAIALRPDSAEAHYNLGLILNDLLRYDQALEHYARAVELNPDNVEAWSNRGAVLHKLARYREALESADRALVLAPDHPEAIGNRGAALHKLERYEEALDSFDRALAIGPAHADTHFNRGVTLRKLQRFEEALESLDRAIAIDAHRVNAHLERSASLYALDRFEEALESCDRALAIAPECAEAHRSRGATLNALRRYDEALTSLDHALRLDPRDAQAEFNRGMSWYGMRRFSDALASFDRAIATEPDHIGAHCNRGVALHRLGRHEEALESFDRAIALDADYLDAHTNRGATLNALRRLDEALASCERALAIDPACTDAQYNRGIALIDLRRPADALASFDDALRLGRRDVAIYRYRGGVLRQLDRFVEAIESYSQGLALEPRFAFLLGRYRHACMEVGDWRGFETDLLRIAGAVQRGDPVISPFALSALLDAPPLQRQATEFWAGEKLSPKEAPAPLPRYPRHGKIRLGYFSADLREHAVGLLAAGLFELHDRSRFELTAFALGPDTRDELRTRVEAAFDRFVPVDGLSDREIAALARKHEIDIAVDLGGLTGDARPMIFAQRAAPIQVSYLGYLGTSGAPFIDYLIADPVLIPPESRTHYSEKIAYLPSYQVNDSKRPLPQKSFSRAELGLPPSGFVFCCFNSTYKITPDTFDSWMRILAAVPGSVLWLLGSSEPAERNLRGEAERRGVDPRRLIFGRPLPFADYLARYRAADLFLDTLPYNAGTTASDALWIGLPVLTLPGQGMQARMAASLLTAAGLPELIAADRAGYERLAIALATDPQRLAALKRTLEDNRHRCALFDTAAFTRNLEALFRRMYDRHLEGLLPEHLDAPMVAS